MTSHGIAILGSSGQVARALVREASARGVHATAGGRPRVDVADYHSVATFLYETQPRVVINAAAYTAVDKAESEPGEAFRINAEAPARLAALCAAARVPLIHISTDYVFDGQQTRPYVESDPMHPLGVYGASKAAGEDAVRTGCAEHIILRTSWVYSGEGHNFLRTMLRLGAEREIISVVDDQHGAPTSADDLAGAILTIAAAIEQAPPDALWGTFHLTGAGETTWYGFAVEIFRLAAASGSTTPRLVPIPTREYPTPALRPASSRLDNGKIGRTFGIALPSWQQSLAGMMARIAPHRI
ncbi:MAG: dTDP-4-dehydrorhamnose reductase [Hyphomicrobium sp.]